MKKIVFIRHGQSLYNLENRFTGWIDIDLTDEGYNGARVAGSILKKHGLTFDVAHTSVLKRSIRTLWILLHEMDLVWIPVHKSWRLNERHYGALQGMNKDEVVKKFGEEQVNEWRRSATVQPPVVPADEHLIDQSDPKYASIGKENIPFTESLIDTENRTLVYWNEHIVPDLQSNKQLIISAHGNTLRALVKYLDNITNEKVSSLNIPNSIPLVYELDDDLTPIRHYYLSHDGEVNHDKIPLHMDIEDKENFDWI